MCVCVHAHTCVYIMLMTYVCFHVKFTLQAYCPGSCNIDRAECKPSIFKKATSTIISHISDKRILSAQAPQIMGNVDGVILNIPQQEVPVKVLRVKKPESISFVWPR